MLLAIWRVHPLVFTIYINKTCVDGIIDVDTQRYVISIYFNNTVNRHWRCRCYCGRKFGRHWMMTFAYFRFLWKSLRELFHIMLYPIPYYYLFVLIFTKHLIRYESRNRRIVYGANNTFNHYRFIHIQS